MISGGERSCPPGQGFLAGFLTSAGLLRASRLKTLGVQAVCASYQRNILSQTMLKRSFDVAAAAIGLIVFSPLLIGVAIWVRLDSPGPIFYRGRRGGRGNRPFGIYKFRSMVTNADKIGGSSTAGEDPRVTKSGRFIRRYKIDELSQLINVLVGDMSLVGPRPEITAYTDKYEGEFLQIMSIRPGITDWASIWNADEGGVLAGAADPDRAYEIIIQPTKLQLQLRYVRTRSFFSDLRIILYTVRRIIDADFYPRELADVPRLEMGAGARVGLHQSPATPTF